MSILKYISFQCAKTQCDSSEESQLQISLLKATLIKHKTQLCKTYSQLGYCNYGEKCRFAHGKHELIEVPINRQLRKRRCNGYWGKGYCSYGIRCQFGHYQQNNQDTNFLRVTKGIFMIESCQSTKISKIINYL